MADTPAKPKAKTKTADMKFDDENMPAANGKQKSASEMYQKVSHGPNPT